MGYGNQDEAGLIQLDSEGRYPKGPVLVGTEQSSRGVGAWPGPRLGIPAAWPSAQPADSPDSRVGGGELDGWVTMFCAFCQLWG